MTQTLLKEVIQSIESNYPFKDIASLIGLYQKLPAEKVSLYLSGLKDIGSVLLQLENVALPRQEVEKGVLMFLGALDNCFAVAQPASAGPIFPLTAELKNSSSLLSHIQALDQVEVKEKIFIGYLTTGINLFKNFPHRPEALSEKIILGEFHNAGGFVPGIWGVSVNLELFSDLTKNINDYSDEKVGRLAAKYSQLKLEELSMLGRFGR